MFIEGWTSCLHMGTLQEKALRQMGSHTETYPTPSKEWGSETKDSFIEDAMMFPGLCHLFLSYLLCYQSLRSMALDSVGLDFISHLLLIYQYPSHFVIKNHHCVLFLFILAGHSHLDDLLARYGVSLKWISWVACTGRSWLLHPPGVIFLSPSHRSMSFSTGTFDGKSKVSEEIS